MHSGRWVLAITRDELGSQPFGARNKFKISDNASVSMTGCIRNSERPDTQAHKAHSNTMHAPCTAGHVTTDGHVPAGSDSSPWGWHDFGFSGHADALQPTDPCTASAWFAIGWALVACLLLLAAMPPKRTSWDVTQQGFGSLSTRSNCASSSSFHHQLSRALH